ncbi:alpha/beta fold hydrolase [Actinoplanes sp. DH11]|uniref:alpha/beta fold hydrolase n=1 Tax=Actinoplanes sp. DH11 TaxID=2857011 RepID=UPI001E518E39|nr:alpha/beta hydrolase [Actinoplanes sp. DH11]
MPEPSSVEDITTTFGTVRAYRWVAAGDDRSPILLLPGRSAGTPMWGENLPSLLATGRTVVAVDAVGDAGMSVQTAPLRNATDQAAWIEQTLERMGLGRVHSMGHSFGGATALAHARHHPGRLASMALIEPVFSFAWPPPATLFWAFVSTLPGPRRWHDHALAAIGGVTVEEIRAVTPIGSMIAAGVEHFRAALPTPRPQSRAALAAITVPAYVAIAGQRSQAGGTAAAARARLIPGAHVEIWPDTTHSLPMQVPGPLADRLTAFWTTAENPM